MDVEQIALKRNELANLGWSGMNAGAAMMFFTDGEYCYKNKRSQIKYWMKRNNVNYVRWIILRKNNLWNEYIRNKLIIAERKSCCKQKMMYKIMTKKTK